MNVSRPKTSILIFNIALCLFFLQVPTFVYGQSEVILIDGIDWNLNSQFDSQFDSKVAFYLRGHLESKIPSSVNVELNLWKRGVKDKITASFNAKVESASNLIDYKLVEDPATDIVLDKYATQIVVDFPLEKQMLLSAIRLNEYQYLQVKLNFENLSKTYYRNIRPLRASHFYDLKPNELTLAQAKEEKMNDWLYLPLNILNLRGDNLTPQQLVTAKKVMDEIWQECGIHIWFENVRQIVDADDTPVKFNRIKTATPEVIGILKNHETMATKGLPITLLGFIERRHGWAVGNQSGSFYEGPLEEDFARLLKIGYIFMDFLTTPSMPYGLSHEIGHIVFSQGHDTSSSNLMGEYALSGNITKTQCEKARNFITENFPLSVQLSIQTKARMPE